MLADGSAEVRMEPRHAIALGGDGPAGPAGADLGVLQSGRDALAGRRWCIALVDSRTRTKRGLGRSMRRGVSAAQFAFERAPDREILPVAEAHQRGERPSGCGGLGSGVPPEGRCRDNGPMADQDDIGIVP